MSPQKPGRKAQRDNKDVRIAELGKKLARAEKDLRISKGVIELQKKVAALFADEKDETS